MSSIFYDKVAEIFIYLMVCIRLDIALAMKKVSISNLSNLHLKAMKWFLVHLKHVKNYGFFFVVHVTRPTPC